MSQSPQNSRAPWISIRIRLLALLLFATLPPVGLMLHAASETRELTVSAGRADVQAMAEEARLHVEEEIKMAALLLRALAHDPVVAGDDRAACSDFLAELSKGYKRYANFWVAKPSGEVLCDALHTANPPNLADREHFRLALETKNELVVGNPMMVRLSEQGTLPLVLPAVEGHGAERRVLAALLALDWFGEFLQSTTRHRNFTFTLWDREGTVLYRYPDNEKWAGQSFKDVPLVKAVVAREDGGTAEILGLDGVARLYAFTSLTAHPESGVQISVGIPTADLVAEADRIFLRSLIALAGIALVAVAAAWALAERYIRRPVMTLVRASERLAAGELGVRIGGPYPSGETGALMAAFDHTAASLQRQHEEIERSAEELRQTNRVLRVLSEGNQALIRATDEQGLLETVCRILVEDGGYRLAWVGYAGGDADKGIRPVAWNGLDERAPSREAAARGPADIAVRTGKPHLSRHVVDDAELPPGHQVAPGGGCTTVIALPLRIDSEVAGALSVWSAERDAFPEPERRLLAELADDLSYGITALRLRIRHRQSEEELRKLSADLERRVAERTAELEATSRQVADLYNNAPCGYHSLDENAVIVRINDTELSWLGYSREEVLGRLKITDLVTPESVRTFHMCFPPFKQTGQIADVEFEMVCKDGRIFPVSLSATAVRDEQGRYVMSRSTLFDITERRRVDDEIRRLNADLEQRAAQLESLNKELESFTYSVSHDLRAPLRAIDGFSRILQEDYRSRLDDEGRRILQVVRDGTTTMARLIDDLLAFSRLGRRPINAAEVDMEALAREVAGEIQAQSGAPAVALRLAPMPSAWGDRALLRQVWGNLLANAIKFSAKKAQPEVEVGGHVDNHDSVFFVRDNGAGFDMRYYDKLFGVFQRLHSAEEYPGTGVGLAIVQRVVTRHGGRVWAESKQGEGATFWFALPETEAVHG